RRFDGFWASANLQHIPISQWPRMLRNITCIMRRGAIGFFSIPSDRMHGDDLDCRHFTLVSVEDLQRLMVEHKWTIIRMGAAGESRKTRVWRWYVVRIW